MMKKLTIALIATTLFTITAYAAVSPAAHDVNVIEKLNTGATADQNEIADMISYEGELYLEDGTQLPVIYLRGGIAVDENGYKCDELGEGTYKLHDGQLAYLKNPVLVMEEWVAY